MNKNYFKLPIEEDLYLVYPEVRMAKEIFELIDSDREHIREFLDFVDEAVDYKNQEEYFKMKLKKIAKQTDAVFLISIQDKLIGRVNFHNINYISNQAEIGYWIHSKYSNKGIMTRVIKKMCEYAFENLCLNRLTIVADTENIASNKVAIKNGFAFAGTQKEEIVLYGEYRDVNHYYLLKREYFKDN